MTAIKAIVFGIRSSLRNAWLAVVFYSCGLLLAAIVAAPMYGAIADHLGNSGVGNELARGFDLNWLTEFQITYAPFLKGFSTLLAWTGVLFLALNTVLSAGAYQVLADAAADSASGNTSARERVNAFGRGIGRYFIPFAALVLIASLAYFIVFWLWQGPAARLLDYVFANSVHEAPVFYLNWLRWALLTFCVVAINLIVEYAKADLVSESRTSVLASLGQAAGFVFARFGRVLFIYLVIGSLTLLTIALYAAFARYFPQATSVTVLIWFVVAQVLLLSRWIFRIASWGAAVAYKRQVPALSPAPIESAVEVA